MSTNSEKLIKWNEQGKFQNVINAVEALPITERDYETISQYARALNNNSRYEEALAQLDLIREQAKSDAYWFFRYGYSLYYLDGREAEAIPYFERAIELGDDWPDTYEMLQWAKDAAKNDDDENEENGESESSEADDNPCDFVPMAFATLSINMRLRPEDRYERIEHAIELFLRAKDIGCVTGGGTQLNEYGEPESCDVEIDLKADTDEIKKALISAVTRLSIAKGSKLIYSPARDDGDAESIIYPIGNMEGLALYLNLDDIPEYIFETYTLRNLVDELYKLLSKNGAMISSYSETKQGVALYYYSQDEFDDMYAKIAPFIKTYPICDKCRVVELGLENGKEFLISVPLPKPTKNDPTNIY